MDLTIISKQLNALGNETRLKIMTVLAKSTSVTVGEVQKHLNIPHSTLSHHISKLAALNLINQVRDKNTLYCSVNDETLKALQQFFSSYTHTPKKSL